MSGFIQAQEDSRLEKLSQQKQDALFEYINSHAADVHGVPFEERVPSFGEYTKRFMAKYKDDYRMITVKDIPGIMAISNMTLSDIYKVWGVTVTWPDEETKWFYNQLTTLYDAGNEKALNYIYKYSENSIPSFFTSNEVKSLLPTAKLIMCRRRLYGRKEHTETDSMIEAIDKTALKKLNDRHMASRVDITTVAACANIFNISLKWVLGLPATSPCWTKNLMIDNIVSNYLLCRNNSRRNLRALINAFAC